MASQFGSLISKDFYNNFIFKSDDTRNRDGGFSAWILLRSRFSKKRIELNTEDVNKNCLPCFNIHLDAQLSSDSLIPNYLIMLEAPQVYPLNANIKILDKYRRVFTWRDDLVDNQRFIKINFPNNIVIPNVDGFSGRDKFCCLISSNKSLSTRDCVDLYLERVKTIKWFEKNAIADFRLYGSGWDNPAIGRGMLGKVIRIMMKRFGFLKKYVWFPSYCGVVEKKTDVLKKTKFSICYENVSDLPGYITEKIFDCFFSGCVPVYWGACNITDYIPADCFIDRRQFNDTESVYLHLKAMPEQEFIHYQQRIAAFLKSDKAYVFSSEHFAETIVNTIVQDLAA